MAGWPMAMTAVLAWAVLASVSIGSEQTGQCGSAGCDAALENDVLLLQTSVSMKDANLRKPDIEGSVNEDADELSKEQVQDSVEDQTEVQEGDTGEVADEEADSQEEEEPAEPQSLLEADHVDFHEVEASSAGKTEHLGDTDRAEETANAEKIAKAEKVADAGNITQTVQSALNKIHKAAHAVSQAPETPVPSAGADTIPVPEAATPVPETPVPSAGADTIPVPEAATPVPAVGALAPEAATPVPEAATPVPEAAAAAAGTPAPEAATPVPQAASPVPKTETPPPPQEPPPEAGTPQAESNATGGKVAKAEDKTKSSMPNLKDATAAEAAGVGENGKGDLSVAVTSFFTNIFLILVYSGAFLVCRFYYPEVMEGRLINRSCGPTDYNLPRGSFDWIKRSLATTVDGVQDSSGLDMAMLLEYTNLCMKILAIIGIPMIFIVGTMNCLFGGFAAGEDYLSYLSFGNVQNGSWLYWIHCIVVWLVVFTVQICAYGAMDRFMLQRSRWLRELPAVEANTILIEHIPEQYRSDGALKKYFQDIYGSSKVRSASCVKLIPELEAACCRKEAVQYELDQAKYKESQGEEPAKPVRQLESELNTADVECRAERRIVNNLANQIGGVNCCNGFVSFTDRCDAERASVAVLGPDASEWVVSQPPPPECVIWRSLQAGKAHKSFRTIIGYALVFGLYALYLPLVIWIGELAESINMGPLQPLWAAYAPTLGLLFMVSMLPTFLQIIFSYCFNVVNTSDSQRMIQNWYFTFQVVFVLLVTAIGGSLWSFMDALATHPFSMFEILGRTMPPATHFFMNYLMLAWAAHGMNLTRYIQVGKFVLFSKIFEKEQALELSEPEDQDFYGIGSRSARFSIMMSIGLVFGTLCPPMNLLAFINFCICRIVYGYLMCFAETKKPDRGGEFFVQQLKHLFVANMIYCVVMTGVLLGRASTSKPGMIAAASLMYVIFSYQRFNNRYSWERLSLHEVSTFKRTRVRPDTGEYIQPELKEK